MKRRTLTREEKTLWAHVQRSVSPFPGRTLEQLISETPAARDAMMKKAAAPQTQLQPQTPRAPQPPPLAPIERSLLRKVKRGRRDIDGVLDLHGLTQGAAHQALLNFLHRKQNDGASLVIVITGKGAMGGYDDPDRERGVLRRMVPHWLRLADLRSIVLGFEQAAAQHGGDGALYVRLRRMRGLYEA